jgi:hypothetical protein
MIIYKINPATGVVLAETKIKDKETLPDILSWQNGFIYMRNMCFDNKLNEVEPNPHLYPTKGFLDNSWWHRHYWIIGTKMESNYGGWPKASRQYPSGRILIRDNNIVYGYGRPALSVTGSHAGLGGTKYSLYSLDLTMQNKQAPEPKPNAKKGKRKKAKFPPRVYRWQTDVPVFVRAMVLTQDKLFIAGPTDLLQDIQEATMFADIKEQADILKNPDNGILQVISTSDGDKIAEYPLNAQPMFDGLIAADKKLFISTIDGKLICIGNE